MSYAVHDVPEEKRMLATNRKPREPTKSDGFQNVRPHAPRLRKLVLHDYAGHGQNVTVTEDVIKKYKGSETCRRLQVCS